MEMSITVIIKKNELQYVIIIFICINITSLI
jgi:hypothetical protein